jgi:endonuclease/exonuclease/phosphatase family metal-dependent hydrolase
MLIRYMGTMAESARLVRVGTLNVHMFRNRGGQDTHERIAQLLARASLDVVALQEATGALVPILAAKLGGWSWCFHRNTAVLSRLPLCPVEEFYPRGVGLTAHAPRHRLRQQCACNRTRYVCCDIAVHGSVVRVLCVHLDHRHEPRRLSELYSAISHLSLHVQPASPDPNGGARNPCGILALPILLLGDLNALSRRDYNDAEWERIARVRKDGRWEKPQIEVTMLATGSAARDPPRASRPPLGLLDTRVVATTQSGPKETSRFGTRIDYIFVSEQLLGVWRAESCEHVVAMPEASDHNLVVTELRVRARQRGAGSGSAGGGTGTPPPGPPALAAAAGSE